MVPIVLPVTLAAAGAAGLINLWHFARIVRLRFSEKVLIGDGGNARLAARMRAQLNFAEYTPLFLILLGLIELAGAHGPWLWGGAGVFVAGRIAHPFGMDGFLPARQFGTLTTVFASAGVAVYALLLAVNAG